MHARAMIFVRERKPLSVSDITDISITVDRSTIEEQQERSMCHMASAACRIRVDDPETKKSTWFAVIPMIKNGKPGVTVEAIGTESTAVRKSIMGKWRSGAYDSGIEENINTQ